MGSSKPGVVRGANVLRHPLKGGSTMSLPPSPPLPAALPWHCLKGDWFLRNKEEPSTASTSSVASRSALPL